MACRFIEVLFTIEQNRLLTSKEAMAFLNVSKPTFRNILESGDLKAYDMPTGARERRCLRFSRKALEEFLETRET